MQKKIANYVQQKGLVCDKNSFSGKIDGIEIYGFAPRLSPPTLSFAAYIPDESLFRLRNWIEGNKRKYAIINYKLDRRGVGIYFNQVTVKKYLQFFDLILPVIKENCMVGVCPFCGEAMENPVYVEMDCRRFHSHEKCFDEYVQSVQTAENIEAAKPVKLVRGIIGAIIGSLLGCVVWAILYYIGFIAVIAALLTSYGAAFMWDKFGGKNCNAKIVTVWIVTFVMLSVTMFALYIVAVELALYQNGLSGSSLEWFKYLLEEDEELRISIITNTIISYIFILAGNFMITVRIRQTQSHESKRLRKLQ